MGISTALLSRIESDAKSPAFWSVPKGQAVHPDNWPRIAEHLRVLKEFEGIPWQAAQPQFAKALLRRRLIEPYQDTGTGYSAVARMQFPIWRLLGFAWINKKREPEITEVGQSFLKAKSRQARREVLTAQLHRYQFYNPSIPSHFRDFRTFPVLAIYRLLTQTDWYLTQHEFLLFGTRIRSFSDADELGRSVEEWRGLENDERKRLLATAQTLMAKSHTKSEDRTTWGKVRRDLAYLRAVLSILPTLQFTADGQLLVPHDMRKRVQRIVLDSSKSAEYIDYESEQDWLAVYGRDSNVKKIDKSWTTASDARAYYEVVGRIDAATQAYAKESRRTEKQINDYRSVKIHERTLEDLLEHNLEKLEAGLRLIQRQYKTPNGTIDLLAKDANGIHVVIELKRDTVSDKVIGQIARYITWVSSRLGRGRKSARGMIVGREFDKNFAAAIAQLKRITPYTFDLLVHIEQWKSNFSKK